MRSAIYTGWVRHRRYEPKAHAFRYRMFQMYLDLDELSDVFKGCWFWSARRFSLAWFRRRDHFGDPETDLATCVRDLVEQESGTRPNGRIALLTHLRYFGYCINPVSFYYIFSEDHERVETIVAEVHNTPWGERHCYVLPRDRSAQHPAAKPHKFQKSFHVSPFMPMDQRYIWRLSDPTDKLVVHMQNEQQERLVFDATLVMRRIDLNAMNRARVLLRHPFMTGKVAAAIYWNALRLWIKKVPFHPHPERQADQGKAT